MPYSGDIPRRREGEPLIIGFNKLVLNKFMCILPYEYGLLLLIKNFKLEERNALKQIKSVFQFFLKKRVFSKLDVS